MSHFFVGMTLAYTFICCRAQTDLTLVPGSSGEDVVDACIQKLSAISLFTNDYGFLKRIALFESKFGSNSTVINANPTGGIWQITTAISQAISSGTTSQAILDQARLSLGNDVTNFADGDFSIPLKSALAARLYVEYIQLTQISPATVYEQAIWWSQYYNLNGQSKYFQTTVTNYEYTNKCSVSKADFYFLMDGSGSITSQNFKQSLKFIDQLASEISISSKQVRTGLTVYSDRVYPISQFDQHQSNGAFRVIVTFTPYPDGGTNTGEGIEFVRTTMFNTSTGMRPLADGAQRILLVLTDGKSQDNVVAPSTAIKEDGVTVFCVGVGSGYVQDEIYAIASDPDSAYAFGLSQFDQMVEILKDRISVQACKIPALVPDDKEVPILVESGHTHYFEVQMPTNGSIELNYTVTTVSPTTVYVSSSTTNPNSAIHDFYFNLQPGVTVVAINSGETATSAVELFNHTSTGPSLSINGSMLAIGNIETYPVFVAVEAGGNQPLEATVKSTGSNTRHTGGAEQKIEVFAWISAIILYALLASALLFGLYRRYTKQR